MENKNFEESIEIIKRLENFYINLDDTTILDKLFYVQLQGLCLQIEVDIQKLRGISEEAILKMIFSRVYNFVISFNEDYTIFDNNMKIYDDTFSACFFNVLCLFLHHTKRLKAYTLREFVYLHAPENYNVPGTFNYFDYQRTKKNLLRAQV